MAVEKPLHKVKSKTLKVKKLDPMQINVKSRMLYLSVYPSVYLCRVIVPAALWFGFMV